MKKETRIIILGVIGTLLALSIFLGVLYLIFKNQNNDTTSKETNTMETNEALNQDEETNETFNTTNSNDNQEETPNIELPNTQNDNQEETITIYLFHGSTCPHCVNALASIQDNIDKYANYNIVTYEVWEDPDNRNLFGLVAQKLNTSASSVPFFVIGSKYIVGFKESEILTVAQEYIDNNDYQDIVKQTLEENPDLTAHNNIVK